jgi:toxin CptA
MHNAPAVSFPVGRSHFQAWLLSGVWVAGAAACVYWASVMDGAGWRHGLALAMPVAAGAAAWCGWRRGSGGCLHWDGQGWRLEATAASPSAAARASVLRSDAGSVAGIGTGIEMAIVEVSLHLDLQFFLLLRLRLADGSVRWLWLDQGRDLLRWQALRRAVHANADATLPASLPASVPASALSLGVLAESVPARAPEGSPLQKAQA